MRNSNTATQPIRILIINPNTSQSMTAALRAPIESLGYNSPETQYSYFTPPPHPTHPGGLSSINSPEDAALSTDHALPKLLPLLRHHDAFLVACFSPHPLVGELKRRTAKPVMGIFEASVASAVQLLSHIPRVLEHKEPEKESDPEGQRGESTTSHLDATTATIPQPKAGTTESLKPRTQKFAIITTAAIWGPVLRNAVRSADPEMLGPERASSLFAGVQTVGLNAGDLHGGPQQEGEVERRVREAVRKLVEAEEEKGGEVGVIVLGCAGMVGMERWVREEWAGLKNGGRVCEEGKVVDGVKAGVGILQGLLRGRF